MESGGAIRRTSVPRRLREQEQRRHRLETSSSDRLPKLKAAKWKKLSPDQLAAKLNLQKLLDSFPHLNRKQLLEMWQATGNNYRKTVESILASTSHRVVVNGDVFEPAVSETLLIDMKAEQEYVAECPARLELCKSVASYREEAAACHRKRSGLFQKADHYKPAMREVANFFVEVALQLTRQRDLANCYAASGLEESHRSTDDAGHLC